MRVYSALLLLVSITVFTGCSGSATNSNANANTSTAETSETPLPEFTDANEALAAGIKLFDDGKTEMSIEAFNQAVKINPDLADGYFRLGIAHGLLEAMAKNNAAPMEVVTEEPTPTPDPKGKKTEKAPPKTESAKAFTKAVEAYKKIIDADSRNHSAFFNMGRALNKLDEDEDSAKALKQAVKLNPEDAEYQTELGAILVKLAQYAEAVIALKKAVELDPENSAAIELLEDAEAGRKRVDFQNPPKKDEEKKSGKPGASPSPGAEGTPDGSGTKPPPTPAGPKPPSKPTPKPPAKP